MKGQWSGVVTEYLGEGGVESRVKNEEWRATDRQVARARGQPLQYRCASRDRVRVENAMQPNLRDQ